MGKRKMIFMIFVAVYTAIIVSATIAVENYIHSRTDNGAVKGNETESTNDVGMISELEALILDSEEYVEISELCEVVEGNNEYGFFYEIKMYDGSGTTYYEADGAYEIVEESESTYIVETIDYYIICKGDNKRVFYKNIKSNEENEGDNAIIGIIGE